MIEIIIPFIFGACAVWFVSMVICVTTYANPGSHLKDVLTVLRCATAALAIAIVLLVATVAFPATPSTTHLTDHVDLIEVNHYYDSQGRLIFDQVIFLNWSVADERFQVVAWRMLKNGRQIPRMDWRKGVYVARWRDGEVWREVVAGDVRETWTTYDPEYRERDLLPQEYRRDLACGKPLGLEPARQR